MVKFYIFLLLIILPFLYLHPQEKSLISAKELLSMDSDKAFELIGRLNKTQTSDLISQIRVYAREEYKEIDKFYLLISHLENIKAIEEEDKKLKDLNLVYFLALTLFSAFIGFSLFSQRKSIQAIQDHLKQ
jgi:hypothetical protein